MAGPWEKYKKPTAKGPWEKYKPAPGANWSDLPGNILPSAANVASGLYQAVRHPYDTVEGIARIGSGAVNNAMPETMKSIDAFLSDKGLKQPSDQGEVMAQRELAGQAGKALKNRYGGLENIKRTMITDPVGSALDVSLLFGGGAALAGKSSQIGSALNRASRVTNPLTLPAKALVKGTKLAGKAASYPLGITTGAGPAAIQEAGRTGAVGGDAAQAFRANLRETVPVGDVIEMGKGAVANMAEGRRNRYMEGMQQTAAAQAPIDVAPIVDEFQKLRDSLYTKGPGSSVIDDAGQVTEIPGGTFQKAAPAEVAKMGQMEALLQELRSMPGGTSPIMLDALKQRISRMAPASIAENSGNEMRLVTGASNAVKDAIVKQVPSYASAMEDYAKSTEQIREIEKTLKLSGRASQDQSLRALQSIMRNNANTNYGARVNSAKALEEAGAKNLMPALAGQMLSSGAPRGLAQILAGGAGGAGIAGAFSNPATLASLPFIAAAASPRAVGEIAHALGRAGRRMPKADLKKLLAAALAGRTSQSQENR
jgi:hypothetical protein